MLHVEQHDVEVFGLRLFAHLVDRGLRIGVVGGDLRHERVAVAGKPLESNAEHLVHLRIGLRSLKEADAVIVGVAHQARESILPQLALHAPLWVPVPKARRVTFTSDFPSVTQSVAVRLGKAEEGRPCRPSAPVATPVFKKFRLESRGIADLPAGQRGPIGRMVAQFSATPVTGDVVRRRPRSQEPNPASSAQGTGAGFFACMLVMATTLAETKSPPSTVRAPSGSPPSQ